VADTQPSELTLAWETALAAEGFTLTDPAGEAEALQIAEALEMVAREGLTTPGRTPEAVGTLVRLAAELRAAPAVLRAARQ
jgi:hypothetical protein